MSDDIYSVHVCALCGAQVVWTGNEYGWEFRCEHSSWMDEYGSVEPLEVEVEAPTIAARLAGAAPGLARQREEHMAEVAQRRAREEARRAALSDEEREAEDRQNAVMTDALKSLMMGSPLLGLLDPGRQIYGTTKKKARRS